MFRRAGRRHTPQTRTSAASANFLKVTALLHDEIDRELFRQFCAK